MVEVQFDGISGFHTIWAHGSGTYGSAESSPQIPITDGSSSRPAVTVFLRPGRPVPGRFNEAVRIPIPNGMRPSEAFVLFAEESKLQVDAIKRVLELIDASVEDITLSLSEPIIGAVLSLTFEPAPVDAKIEPMRSEVLYSELRIATGQAS